MVSDYNLGAKRFLELVADDFFNNATFFRVMPKFLVQFGIGSEPEKNRRWARKGIPNHL
jgi:peptidyl-prolyl cis-trans isomerase A (cyclophilin A)